jgi:hypothetical protein
MVVVISVSDTENIEQGFALLLNTIVKAIPSSFDPVFLIKRGIMSKRPLTKSQQLEQQRVTEQLTLGNSNITYDMDWM